MKIYLKQSALIEHSIEVKYRQSFLQKTGLLIIGEDCINFEDVFILKVMDRIKASLYILKNPNKLVYE